MSFISKNTIIIVDTKKNIKILNTINFLDGVVSDFSINYDCLKCVMSS